MKKNIAYCLLALCALCTITSCRAKKEVKYSENVEHRSHLDKNTGIRTDSTYITSTKTTVFHKKNTKRVITERTQVAYPDSVGNH